MEKPTRTRCDEIEEMLTPVADGEAGADVRQAVDEHLERCPRCARRFEAEDAARAVVHARRPALQVAAPEALRARCRPPAPPRSRLRRWVPLSLAATLFLAVGGAFLLTLGRPTEALAAELALDHMKCFKTQDITARADAAAVARDWEQTQGWTIPVVPGMPDEGIALVGLRRCFSTSGQMAHLMYSDHGQPLSVYVLRRSGAGAHELEVLGQRTVIWSSGDRTYAVVGNEAPEVLARVCAHVRQAVAR
jgi:anti-sigma factor (TIGR02949 family)